jgi:hypothetical protein
MRNLSRWLEMGLRQAAGCDAPCEIQRVFHVRLRYLWLSSPDVHQVDSSGAVLDTT